MDRYGGARLGPGAASVVGAFLIAALLVGSCAGEEFTSDGAAAAGGGGGSGAEDSGGCGPQEKLCGGQCVARDDPSFGCNRQTCAACDLPNAKSGCEPGSGDCIVTECDPGFIDCTEEAGCESNRLEPAHCGSCGTTCQSGEVCSTTGCQADCGTKTNCSGSCVDTQTDPSHCGGCGSACASPSNGTAACQNGNCTSLCDNDFADCDANGTCESNLNTLASCGACNQPCPQAPNGGTGMACVNKQCSCEGSDKACPGPASTIACVDTTKDPAFCGGCTTKCGFGKTCVGGTCAVPLGCTHGLTECGAGCVNRLTSGAHCGACGNGCGTKNCSNGQCLSAICAGALTLCNGGCTNTLLDPGNCGTCGNVCTTLGNVCLGGTCKNVQFAGEPWQCVGQKACPTPSYWGLPGLFFCTDLSPCPA